MNSNIDENSHGRKIFEEFKKNVTYRWSGSTFHGFHNIPIAKHKLTKLIWTLIFSVSFSLFVYSSVLNILNYLEYNVITTSRIVNEAFVEFPTVSFCNLNMFSKNNTKLNEILVALGQNASRTKYKTMQNFEKLRKLQYLIKSYASGANLSDEQRKSFGLSIEDMLISCYFNGVSCSEEDFEWVYTFDYGNCFAFNSGFSSKLKKSVPMKKVERKGQQNGLRLELFLGIPDINDISLTYTSGLHLFFGNKSNIEYELIGFDIPTGFQTNIALEKTIINKLSTPNNECFDEPKSSNLKNNPFVDLIFNLSLNYSQNQCFDLCYQYNLIKHCGCYDPIMPSFGSDRECFTNADLICDYEFNDYFTNNVVGICERQCPPECNKLYYTYTTSNSQFPTKYYAKYFIKDFIYAKFFNSSALDFQTIQDSNLAISVYFEATEHSFIKEIPETNTVNLLSQIGGTMGIFLGASILSYFELFEVFLESIFLFYGYFCERFRKRERNDKSIVKI